MLAHLLLRRRRRIAPLALLLVLLAAGAALAATLSLTLFNAVYEGANVRVDWEVSSETDVTGFDLARKSVTEASYTAVASVVPTGQRRYQLLDTNVYRQAAGSAGPANGTQAGPFTYRLTIRSAAGDQSFTTALLGTPSAVQRSWGTIKSMFR